MRKILVAAWLGIVLGLAARAQAPIERHPPQDAPLTTLTLSSRLVTVAVNAVDAQGSPVGGLAQGDFRVFEDGKPQEIKFFDRESSSPLSIVLAIDGSESLLRNEKLELQAARRFVDTLLRPQDELDVIEFSDTVHEIVSFTSDKKTIDNGLNTLEKGASTAMYNAIYLGSQRLGETSQGGGRRRVLVLITDGGDTVHGARYTQAVEQAQRAGVSIYSLIIIPIYADAGRNTGGEHALMQMSADTGGKFFYVEDAKDLAPAFQKVSDDLRTQYILGYYAPAPTSKARADAFRALKIDITEPGMDGKVNLRYRSGYYASK